jgi:site-specific recombinase XerD
MAMAIGALSKPGETYSMTTDHEGEEEARRYRTPHDEYLAEMADEIGDDASDKMKAALANGMLLPALATRQEIMECIGLARKRGNEGLRERNYLLLRMFYATGVRKAEMGSLQMCDIMDNRRLRVRLGKEGKDRLVAVDTGTMALLRAYIESLPPKERAPNQPIFPLSIKQLYNIVKDTGKDAGLVEKYNGMERHFSPHVLRHCFATHATERGMKPFILKKLLGHEHMKTTEMYVHLSMDDVLEEYDNTNPLEHPRRGELPDPEMGDRPPLCRYPGRSAPESEQKEWMVNYIRQAPLDIIQALAVLASGMAPAAVLAERAQTEEPSDDEVLAAYDATHPLEEMGED